MILNVMSCKHGSSWQL